VNKVTIRRIRSLLILVLDIMGIMLIFSSAYYWRIKVFPDIWAPELWLILLSILLTLFLSGTYFRESNHKLPKLPINTFFKSLLAFVPCVFLVYFLGPDKFTAFLGRGVLPIGLVLFGIWATVNRLVINRIYYWNEQNIDLLYLGYSEESALQFLSELKNNDETRTIHMPKGHTAESPIPNYTQYYVQDNHVLNQKKWNGVVLDPNFSLSKSHAEALVNMRLKGIPVQPLSDYYETHWYKIPVHHIGDEWFLNSAGFSIIGSPFSLRLKRLIDIIFASVLVFLSVPIIIFACILIKISSKGGPIFSQTRVGLNGKEFKIYKLRTMKIDAENDGAQWASESDPRITRVGKFLRRTRIDELPQCWNVLKGEMSFIGPRPERPEFTKQLADEIPYYELRNLVKPGLSGWAQVMYPYGSSVSDALKKLEYDLYYIKHQSFLFDLNIMLRTIMVVFRRQGR